MRAVLRGLIRGGVASAVMLAATALPFTVTVDWSRPVTPLPPASGALFIASSTLLTCAGCLLRRRDRLRVASISPQV